MNLTKWFAAGLCITAMTASAGFINSNDFESAGFFGTWSGGVNALEDIVAGSTDVTDADTPLVGVGDSKVLKLDTEGGIWTNEVNQSFELTPVYADMLVKFVPSEELPTLTDGKLAVAIKLGAGDNFYLNVANNNGSTFSWAETAQVISTMSWYRVTVKMAWDSGLETTTAQIYINGTEVGTALTLDGNTTLNSIGFQGTGFVDEVVVRDDDPLNTAVLITLSFSAGIQSVYVGETQKTDGQTVTSGSDLIITAAQWKEIASVAGTDVTVDWVAGAAGDSVATAKVSAATAGKTVTITAQTETSTADTGGSTSFSNAPMNKVATWALANGVTTLTSGIYNNYLFNIDDLDPVPTLLITSIALNGSEVTVTITAGTLDLTQINGTLKIMSYSALDAAPTVHTITFSGTTTATVTKDIGTDKFVKALVE